MIEKVILYVCYEEHTGKILAFKSSRVHKEILGTKAVVTKEQKRAAPQANYYIDGELVFIPDVRSLEEDIARNLVFRKQMYRNEADPLYMEWQYDQTAESEQVWRDKVAEIKLAYPIT
jgi:hypothetical protein